MAKSNPFARTLYKGEPTLESLGPRLTRIRDDDCMRCESCGRPSTDVWCRSCEQEDRDAYRY